VKVGKTRAGLNQIYVRIGGPGDGENKLRLILHDFYHRMAKDLLIGFFFDNKDPKSIADQQLEFLLVAMGVRRTYQGKTPAKAHAALPPILKGHFDRRLILLAETLKDHGLTDSEIRTWVQFENAFADVIIQK
jgi:truncated hemoglobin YjbI